MKFFYQLALLSILLARFVPPSYAVCHTDDLKIGLEEITKLYRKSIDILMDVLDPQSTTISLDFENVLDTVTSYESLKHEYVMAVKKIYEISWKLDRNYGKDGSWRSFSRAAVQIRNKMNILNQSCFDEQDIEADTSGEEDALIAKLLQAVLEMFVAETFLNEHFNHLTDPNSKI